METLHQYKKLPHNQQNIWRLLSPFSLLYSPFYTDRSQGVFSLVVSMSVWLSVCVFVRPKSLNADSVIIKKYCKKYNKFYLFFFKGHQNCMI